MTDLPLIARAAGRRGETAIVAAEGTFRYGDLLAASAAAANRLLAGRADLGGERVAFGVAPGFAHAAVQWGIWRAGGIAVPLAVSHPAAELAHAVADADAAVLVADGAFEERLAPLAAEPGRRLWRAGDLLASAGGRAGDPSAAVLPAVAEERPAMMLYTSGTTSRPKGVVWSHRNLRAQLEALHAAWGWSAADRALGVLPLHHVHGIVNVLTSALWAGAVWEALPRFDAGEVWRRLAGGEVTVFMAVPTIYYRLVRAWEEAPEEERRELSAGARRLRLMVSGSAALPVQTLGRWREITGHTLLERYGMTEIGMALSNPLAGERRAGSVGRPLPGVEVRLVDEAGEVVADGEPGEIEVRGPGVFQEYWRRPAATAAAFRGGWFRTGDLAVVDGGAYRILGRASVDIVKSGGYKISALEIEAVLRDHPGVADCAVVGVPDPEWGERVGAAVVPATAAPPALEELREWARERLAPYKLPTLLQVVDDLPRNPLGKVLKPRVVELFGGGPDSPGGLP
jgi:malonyl-CoA/methylmalonyl-CoA synthetase